MFICVKNNGIMLTSNFVSIICGMYTYHIMYAYIMWKGKRSSRTLLIEIYHDGGNDTRVIRNLSWWLTKDFTFAQCLDLRCYSMAVWQYFQWYMVVLYRLLTIFACYVLTCVCDAVTIFNHLPRMLMFTDFAFRITGWSSCHGYHICMLY